MHIISILIFYSTLIATFLNTQDMVSVSIFIIQKVRTSDQYLNVKNSFELRDDMFGLEVTTLLQLNLVEGSTVLRNDG